MSKSFKQLAIDVIPVAGLDGDALSHFLSARLGAAGQPQLGILEIAICFERSARTADVKFSAWRSRVGVTGVVTDHQACFSQHSKAQQPPSASGVAGIRRVPLDGLNLSWHSTDDEAEQVNVMHTVIERQRVGMFETFAAPPVAKRESHPVERVD